MNIKPLIIFFLLCLLPTFSMAQTVYEGQVINAVTQDALVNATVTLLKDKKATVTNQQGYFRLIIDKKIPNDTLLISYVGFKTYRLPVSAYQENLFIDLEPVSGQLAEVTVGATKAQVAVIEKFNHADVKELRGKEYYPAYSYHTIGLFAKQFEAPVDGTVLTTINLGRKLYYVLPYSPDDYPLMTSNNRTRFLLHIMTIDSLTGAPAKKLFTKEATLTDNSIRITFDLTRERIILPGKKFFVAVEWLITPLNEIIILNIGEKAKIVKDDKPVGSVDVSNYVIMYQPFLVILPQFVPPNSWQPRPSKAPIWESSDGIKWKQAVNAFDIALSATVSY